MHEFLYPTHAGARLMHEAVERASCYFRLGHMNVRARAHLKYLVLVLRDLESGRIRQLKCSVLVTDTMDSLFKAASVKLNDLVDQRLCKLN